MAVFAAPRWKTCPGHDFLCVPSAKQHPQVFYFLPEVLMGDARLLDYVCEDVEGARRTPSCSLNIRSAGPVGAGAETFFKALSTHSCNPPAATHTRRCVPYTLLRDFLSYVDFAGRVTRAHDAARVPRNGALQQTRLLYSNNNNNCSSTPKAVESLIYTLNSPSRSSPVHTNVVHVHSQFVAIAAVHRHFPVLVC